MHAALTHSAPLLDEVEQRVDLSHLGSRQRMLEQCRHERADRRGACTGQAAEVILVARGACVPMGRMIVRVRDALPGHLDALTADLVRPQSNGAVGAVAVGGV
jgi:hypothetical protein